MISSVTALKISRFNVFHHTCKMFKNRSFTIYGSNRKSDVFIDGTNVGSAYMAIYMYVVVCIVT